MSIQFLNILINHTINNKKIHLQGVYFFVIRDCVTR